MRNLDPVAHDVALGVARTEADGDPLGLAQSGWRQLAAGQTAIVACVEGSGLPLDGPGERFLPQVIAQR